MANYSGHIARDPAFNRPERKEQRNDLYYEIATLLQKHRYMQKYDKWWVIKIVKTKIVEDSL